jgi:outer membrane protein, multidrug efflux system
MKPEIAITASLILSLWGCMLGPDYHRPAIDSPDSWRFEEKQAKDTADTAWWKQFGDPVLNELIDIALAENKDVKIAAARIEEFMGRYAFARSPLFPQIGAQASAGRQLNSEIGFFPIPPNVQNPNNLYNASFFASWEIDLWGKLRREAQAARAELLSTQEAKRSIILSLVASVSAAYVNMRSLDRQLEIAQSTVARRKDYYRIFALRFQRGFASELELYQAKSEYDQALATVPVIEKSIAQQEHAISLLLGRNPGPVKRGAEIELLGQLTVPAGLPSSLLTRRPDIRQAELSLIAANARIGAARALFFPSISLTGLLGWTSTDLSSLFTGPARTWNWTVPITQPIFNWGALSGQLKASEAVREESLLQYQAVIQKAFSDVENALIDQRRTRQQLEALFLQITDLSEYARIARLRYNNGYTNYIEVLDAERSQFSAELSYTQTQAALFQALINLYKAMGGGWIVKADDKSKNDGDKNRNVSY